ncbi:MAG: hypothetical protein JSR17_01690 [Proteobacteria bacterium]|nr:hypothetical protein [Pseudomonadota bacterium]
MKKALIAIVILTIGAGIVSICYLLDALWLGIGLDFAFCFVALSFFGLNSKYTQEVIVENQEEQKLFNQIIFALSAIGARIETLSKEKRVVTANRFLSLCSWGQNIKVSFEKLDENKFKVNFESKSLLGIHDFHENKSNIQHCIELMNI